jgi:hypothetical protein
MAVVIDEVQVEAVEAQAQQREAHGQGGQKPAGGKPKLDPMELAATLRRRDQRLARLWAD